MSAYMLSLIIVIFVVGLIWGNNKFSTSKQVSYPVSSITKSVPSSGTVKVRAKNGKVFRFGNDGVKNRHTKGNPHADVVIHYKYSPLLGKSVDGELVKYHHVKTVTER